MNKSGIYSIVCNSTKRIYVGSAVNIRKRWNFHKTTLRRQKHHNSYLQRAWNKYGEADFSFSVLEYVADVNQLLEREQEWMNTSNACSRKTGFNICTIAGSRLGHKPTKATLAKLSRASKGRKLTERTKALISEKAMGNKRGTGKSFHGVLTETNVIQILARSSMGDAPAVLAKEFNVSSVTIRRIARRTIWKGVTVPAEVEAAITPKGTFPLRKGSANARAKMTEHDVVEIRRMLAEGLSCPTIGTRYNVTPMAISRIKHKRSWTHVPEELFL